ncbi:FAR1-related sequence 5-like protein [Tanacetum coccineum]
MRGLSHKKFLMCWDTIVVPSAGDGPILSRSGGHTVEKVIDSRNNKGKQDGNVGHSPISPTIDPNIGIVLINISDSHTTEPNNSSSSLSGPTSYAKLDSVKPSRKSVNFHTLHAPAGNKDDVAIFLESVRPISERFANIVYGFFLGKRDGLSAIATKLGTLLMIDSYTSDMCMQSWGRSSYARVMIELQADVELKDTIMVAMPKLVGEGFYIVLRISSRMWRRTRRILDKLLEVFSGKKKQVVVANKEVSILNPFDVLNSVEKDDELGTNGGHLKSARNGPNYDVFPSDHGFFYVASNSTSTTPIVERFDKIERQIIDRKVMMGSRYLRYLIVPFQIVEQENEVESDGDDVLLEVLDPNTVMEEDIDCIKTPRATLYWDPYVQGISIPVEGTYYDTVDEAIDMYTKYAEMGGINVDTLDPEYSDKQKRNTTTHVTGCKARIKLVLDIVSRRYKLDQFYPKHNRMLILKEYKHFIKKQRKMTQAEKMFIVKAATNKIGATHAHNLLSSMKGGYEYVHGTTDYFKNHQRDVNVFIGESDAQMLINKVENRKMYVPNFTFQYKVENSELVTVFWDDEVAKCNYKEFGDIVSFDATFNSNKYNMKFVPFIGIDNHGKCVTLGLGMLLHEDTKSYTWLLKAFMTSFLKEPTMIIPAYFIDSPLFGLMGTTSRSKSENSFFKSFTSPGATLVSFMMLYESAMERQRYRQETLDFKTIDATPKCDTKLAMERHVARVYTRTIFLLIQTKIIEGCWSCMIQDLKINEGCETVIIRDKKPNDNRALNTKKGKEQEKKTGTVAETVREYKGRNVTIERLTNEENVLVDDCLFLLSKDEGKMSAFVEKLKVLMEEVKADVSNPPSRNTGDVIGGIFSISKPNQIVVQNPTKAVNKGEHFKT